MIEFSATDAVIAQLEATLEVAEGLERLPLLVDVAWQIRQRDTGRALSLAQEAQALLDQTRKKAGMQGIGMDAMGVYAARLYLIRAESDWLFARLDDALKQTNHALQQFSALNHPEGCADAHWLLAMLAIDQGDRARRDAELQRMAQVAAQYDTVRRDVAHAALAFNATFSDPVAAKEAWGRRFPPGEAQQHPAVACWVHDFWGQLANLTSDFSQAVRHFSEVHTLALASGQIRRAIIAATNAGAGLVNLSDYHAALDWTQRGLVLARRAGWPSSIAISLQQTAATLRQLKRLDAARDMLHEALALMAPLAGSRNYAITLWFLGEVEIDSKAYADALSTYERMAMRADALGQPDLQSYARCGQARVLLELNKPLQALACAHAARELGKESPGHQIEVLKILADIHSRHELPLPPQCNAESTALHFLKEALDLSAGIAGLTIPHELLSTVASEHARRGDFKNAYEFSQMALAAREKTHSEEASNRAVAMQITQETERVRAESENQRKAALAQAERLATLENLGTIGREITSNLDPAAIFNALNAHVHALLEVTAFVVYRLASDGMTLTLVFGTELGRPLTFHSIPLNDPDRNAARSARELKEIVVNVVPGTASAIPGTVETLSRMYAPLLVAQRLVGAMTIQSVLPNAYGEREIAIFRTLSAYGAIALANADVQLQLLQKNRQLETASVSDRLTGLYNRVRLDQVLVEEVVRRGRTGAPLSLILLDIDDFKSVNDTYGHPVGDQVLIAVAKLLMEGSREIDVVGRWGGEEFLIVCRETSLDGATVLAEKLRKLIEGHTFDIVGAKTGSFGVSSLRDEEGFESLIARADAAMYFAKRGGRNKIEVER